MGCTNTRPKVPLDCFYLLLMDDTSVSSVPRENRELEDRACRSSDHKPSDIYLGC